MPADLGSTLLLILLESADALAQLWPYVLGGLAVAGLLSTLAQKRLEYLPVGLPKPLALPLAVVMGAASPVPTLGTVPLVLRLQSRGLAPGTGVAFVLASSLMNPLLFLLTLGALGAPFALAQLGGVLLLSAGLGLLFDRHSSLAGSEVQGSGGAPGAASVGQQWMATIRHVTLYLLLGVIGGATLQVLLPRLGVLHWLAARDLLSLPWLGWLGAPFYTCGGSAVPLAGSLAEAGFSPGTLLAFLLVGPALRGGTLASLGCLLPRRLVAICLLGLAFAAGWLGYVYNLLAGVG